MRDAQAPKRCIVEDCKAAAAYAFLAVTGESGERITTGEGRRVRACRPHLLVVVDQITAAFRLLPDGGPARIRAVPLVPAG